MKHNFTVKKNALRKGTEQHRWKTSKNRFTIIAYLREELYWTWPEIGDQFGVGHAAVSNFYYEWKNLV